MRRLALDDMPCGLTVARAVRNAANTVLLERGVVLDARMIGCLRSLGVSHVYVHPDRSTAPPDALEQAVRGEVTRREERRFGDVSGDPYRAALLAATIEIKVGERLASTVCPAAGRAPAAAPAEGGNDA
ncbi:MAG: hypothetical protein ACYDIE_14870 [Candidatus Krumholzibacteriia bacterium]